MIKRKRKFGVQTTLWPQRRGWDGGPAGGHGEGGLVGGPEHAGHGAVEKEHVVRPVRQVEAVARRVQEAPRCRKAAPGKGRGEGNDAAVEETRSGSNQVHA